METYSLTVPDEFKIQKLTVVSVTLTLGAGICVYIAPPPDSTISAPISPRVITTFLHPRRRSSAAAVLASSTDFTERPVRIST